MQLPPLVTHIYDPKVGACPNICSLPDAEAERVLDQLRRTCRPNLKPNYLARRRDTERWLSEQAQRVLGRRFDHGPAYFFLGDFSHSVDPSRQASLILPLSTLPANSLTFTLGDSMRVAGEATRVVYSLEAMAALFETGDAVAGFGFSDRLGFQNNFIEVQVWGRPPIWAPDGLALPAGQQFQQARVAQTLGNLQK